METLNAVEKIFLRDLDRIIAELDQYRDEADIWKLQNGINNSAGTLVLHLCGNIKHFIGTTLGNTGYVRQRDAEFSLRDIPRSELKANVEETKQAVAVSFAKIEPELLNEAYPIEMFGSKQSVIYMLIHLAGHLDYHLGQINYHRRLLS